MLAPNLKSLRRYSWANSWYAHAGRKRQGDSQLNNTKRFEMGLLGLLLAFFSVRLSIICLAPWLGSTDLHSWVKVATILYEGENPYNVTALLNWPPFWLQILFVAGKACLLTSVDFVVVVKLILVVAEAMVLVSLYVVLKDYLSVRQAPLLLLYGICLNPICVLQTCQHANFDVFVGLWTLLFVFMFLRYIETGEAQYWLMAALFAGLGIWTKTVPLFLIPFLFYQVRCISVPLRLVGGFLVFAPAMIAMSVIYVLGPAQVTEHVLQYRSSEGWFGISGILNLLGLQRFNPFYSLFFSFLYAGVLIASATYMSRCGSLSREKALGLVLMLALAIPGLGPGYAPQYIYWFLPLFILYFGIGGHQDRTAIIAFCAVAVPTYLVEYALFVPQGAFLHYLTDRLPDSFYFNLSLQGPQTLVRLPLFLAYLMLLGYLGWMGTQLDARSWFRRFRQSGTGV